MLTRFNATLSIADVAFLKALVSPQILLKVVVALARIRRNAFTIDATWITNRLADSRRVLVVTIVAFTHVRRNAFTIHAVTADWFTLEVGNTSMAFVTLTRVWCDAFRIDALELVGCERASGLAS